MVTKKELQEITDASRIGTFQAISKFCLVGAIICGLFLVIFSIWWLQDNHQDFKFCKKVQDENEFLKEQVDCNYFGAKNHYDFIGVYHLKDPIPTITSYKQNKFNISSGIANGK